MVSIQTRTMTYANITLLLTLMASCAAHAPATQFTRSYITVADRAIKEALGDLEAKTNARKGADSGVWIGNSYTSTFPVENLRERGIDRRELIRRIRGGHEKELADLGLRFEGTDNGTDGAYELRYLGAGRKGTLQGSIREVADTVEVSLKLDEGQETE